MAKTSSGLEMLGEVVMVSGGHYKVKLDGMDMQITADLAGKMRQKKINVLLGEKVWVELSEYDPSKGKIIWRGEKLGEFPNKNSGTAGGQKPSKEPPKASQIKGNYPHKKY